MKARIHQNVWGNWYGYLGARRVESFGSTSQFTAEQEAKLWLREQQREGHTIDVNQLVGVEGLVRYN